MSLAEAKEQAQMLFSDTGLFQVVRASSEPSITIDTLSPELKSLLTEYETIEKIGTETRISRDDVSVWPIFTNFVKIGADLYH